jgi:hypothetical protein
MTNRFTFIAREIVAQIPSKPERRKAAINVSKMRDFSNFFTLQRFLTLCEAN